jgi:hypothetical protein
MIRYTAYFSTSTGGGIKDNRTGRFHARPTYTNIEIGSTVRWLNEREGNYSRVELNPFYHAQAQPKN